MRKIFVIVIASLCAACSSRITGKSEVDSVALRDSTEKIELSNLIKNTNPDYVLDSIDLVYTIDVQKILNKKVLVNGVNIDDIYSDNMGFHIVLADYGGYVADLICTSEQVDYVKKSLLSNFHFVMIPDYAKKMNFDLIATKTDEGDIRVQNDEVPFKITGRLIGVSTESGFIELGDGYGIDRMNSDGLPIFKKK